jgi:Asp-tRNA(Asn)/Glu-tRNA(Gln) amidotransferase A subunit family amidase
MDPADLPAAEAAARIAAGTLTPEALREACLARIAARDGVVRAFAAFDADHVRCQRPRPGPLHGLPIGVKDVLDTADVVSGYGSPIWAGHRPRADASCVAAARRAGAVVMGKTVTTEFATRRPGPTTNPHNPAHTPGGSSQGSAAGVAAGFFPLAFGTQTHGSILRPAAYCGVVGYKPSFGTLHRAGMKVMSESLDTIGVFARDVAGAALAVGAMSGRDLGRPDAAIAPPRLAFCAAPDPSVLDAATQALLERAVAACRAAGAEVVEVTLPEALHRANALHSDTGDLEVAQALAWEFDHAAPLLSEDLRRRCAWAAEQDPAMLDAGRAAFAEARAAFAALMGGFDALLTAVAPGEAPEGLGWTGDPSCNRLWTALHGPAVSVPAGTGPRGLPLGLQVVAPAGQDARLLAVAEWVRARIA